jgi:hypothetical protein
MNKLAITCIAVLALTASLKVTAQSYQMSEIRNCQHEMRTVTFEQQVKFFWKWVYGMSDISKQSILHFAPGYAPDTAVLRQQIEKIRRTVPADFIKAYPTGTWYDNEPDQPVIWFTVVFAKQDKQGNITAFAAYRITFDGNNAHLDEQRMQPKITNLEFIFDKATLVKLAAQLKTLPEAKG